MKWCSDILVTWNLTGSIIRKSTTCSTLTVQVLLESLQGHNDISMVFIAACDNMSRYLYPSFLYFPINHWYCWFLWTFFIQFCDNIRQIYKIIDRDGEMVIWNSWLQLIKQLIYLKVMCNWQNFQLHVIVIPFIIF